MKIALFQGTTFFPSRCIRWLTRSNYSHAAFVFDETTAKAAAELYLNGHAMLGIPNREAGAVIEAWEAGGVRNVQGVGSRHSAGTKVDIFRLENPLTLEEEKALLRWLSLQIGLPYSFRGVVSFVTRKDYTLDGSWFCSEICFEGMRRVSRILFESTQAWEVPPGWIQRSPLLKYERTIIT